ITVVLAALSALLFCDWNNPVSRFLIACYTIACSIDYCVDDTNKLNHAAAAKVSFLYLTAFSLTVENMDIYANLFTKALLVLIISVLSIYIVIYFLHTYVTDYVVMTCLCIVSFCVVGLPTCLVVWKHAAMAYLT
ncbi:hypothetical protein PFISCL1PPCAC_27725, partial [Pristionchus fissidentatus]